MQIHRDFRIDRPMLPCGCSFSVDELLARQEEARRNPSEGPFRGAHRSRAVSRSVARHMAPHVGVLEGVVHEIRSWLVYLEVHLHAPRPGHPYVDLFTTGMSQRPMRVREASHRGHPQRVELWMQFPGAWRGEESLILGTRRPERAWAVAWLRTLARLPHERGGFFQHGKVIAFDEGPTPECPFDSALLVASGWAGAPAVPELVRKGRRTALLRVVPLFPGETDLARRCCGLHVAEILAEAGVDPVVRLPEEDGLL